MSKWDGGAVLWYGSDYIPRFQKGSRPLFALALGILRTRHFFALFFSFQPSKIMLTSEALRGCRPSDSILSNLCVLTYHFVA